MVLFVSQAVIFLLFIEFGVFLYGLTKLTVFHFIYICFWFQLIYFIKVLQFDLTISYVYCGPHISLT